MIDLSDTEMIFISDIGSKDRKAALFYNYEMHGIQLTVTAEMSQSTLRRKISEFEITENIEDFRTFIAGVMK